MTVSPPRAAPNPQAAAPPPAAAPQAEKPVALPPLDYAFQTLLGPLRKSLARIEARLDTTPAAAPPAAAGAKSDEASRLADIHQRFDQLSAELAEFRREATALIESSSPAAAPIAVREVIPEPVAPPQMNRSEAESSAPWENIILGSELCANASLQAIRREFLDGVVAGSVSARALAGQLLLLQATEADELPERFRHVGEAYYRWRPRQSTAADPLERALADWLTQRAEAAGLRNSIQLVRPGDRFDNTRHSATTRGVEVVAVHGWVVIRDGQKVYTKASVTVK